jgi:hypothetical protein
MILKDGIYVNLFFKYVTRQSLTLSNFVCPAGKQEEKLKKIDFHQNQIL